MTKAKFKKGQKVSCLMMGYNRRCRGVIVRRETENVYVVKFNNPKIGSQLVYHTSIKEVRS